MKLLQLSPADEEKTLSRDHDGKSIRNIRNEREGEIHYVHSASLAHEDGIVFVSEPSTARQ